MFFKQNTAYEMLISDWSSDVCSSDLFQVHARVQGRDLVGISIEHERLDPRCEKTRSDAPLRRLAPPGMRHLRINVCIETVFAGRRLGPTGHGLPLGEPDLHNGFSGFETVLPGNHYPYRRAIDRKSP